MTESNKKLRWGIISCGAISQDFCSAFQTLDLTKHQLTACAARDLNDAKNFAERFKIPEYFDSYDKVFQHDKVDVVYIANINTKHKEMCMRAINGRKHILCEKPLCLNIEEEEELFQALKDKNLFFMEALWSRFFPIMKRLREEIKNKTIGDVKFVQANFFMPQVGIPRLEKKELGGGVTLDIGIYPIHLTCMIFDHEEPLEIKATGHLLETGVDRCASIAIKYRDMKLSSIAVAGNCAQHSNMVVAGDKGIIELPRNAWCPTEMILPNGEEIKCPLPDIGETIFLNSAGLRYETDAVREAILNGQREHPDATWAHSRQIMRIIDEVRKQLGYKVIIEENVQP